VEDGYIFATAIADCIASEDSPRYQIGKYTALYQEIQYPRAKQAQGTAREAGAVYEMQLEDMRGLSYEECLPLVRSKLEHGMKWIWSSDIYAEYDGKRRVMESRRAGEP
jgi:salicylate hydroxylase